MATLRPIEVIATVILVAIIIWLLGIVGTIIIFLAGLFLIALRNLYRMYFTETVEKPSEKGKEQNWKCPNCGRINSPRTKICTRCGFEKPIKKLIRNE